MPVRPVSPDWSNRARPFDSLGFRSGAVSMRALVREPNRWLIAMSGLRGSMEQCSQRKLGSFNEK